MKLFYLLISSLLVASLFGGEQEECYWEYLSEDYENKRYQPPAPDCPLSARLYRTTAKHREANGIGYPRGYSSLEGFFSYSYEGVVHPFVDLRAHLTNDGKWAYNAGLGLRKLIEPIRAIFGVNVFYDYRDGRHRRFNQIGAGLELLGKRWDLRLNGYVPIGHSKKEYFDGFRKFKGHFALFAKRYEVAMYGGDLDVGVEIFKIKNWDLHAKLGGYYFHGDFGKMFGGGLFELATNITRYITLKGQASYDNHFKLIVQGELALNFSFGLFLEKNCPSFSCASITELENRLVESVDRFEMIVTINKRKNAKALNPLTGQPLFFVFVDNTSSSAGTFESPFPTLAQAQNLSPDVIYIFPGDGTSKGMNAGIALLNNQGLIGSAAPFIVTTRFGLRTIPPQTLNTPIIQAISGNVVNLANNNTVSGLTILSNGLDGNAGIEGNVVQGAKISFNRFIQSGAENSINFVGFTGNLDVNNNFFQGGGTALSLFTGQNATGTINQNLIACAAGNNGSQSTIFIEPSNNTGGGVQVFSIDSNIFAPPTNSSVDFQAITILTAATSATNYTFFITNNKILNPNANPHLFEGIFINTNDSGGISNLKAAISKNAIANTGLSGIQISSNSTTALQLDINNNFVQKANLTGGTEAAILVEFGTGTEPITLRLAENVSSAVLNAFGYDLFTNGSAPFNVQSLNGQLSGVQILNIGTFVTPGTGQLTFIPFTTPLF